MDLILFVYWFIPVSSQVILSHNHGPQASVLKDSLANLFSPPRPIQFNGSDDSIKLHQTSSSSNQTTSLLHPLLPSHPYPPPPISHSSHAFFPWLAPRTHNTGSKALVEKSKRIEAPLIAQNSHRPKRSTQTHSLHGPYNVSATIHTNVTLHCGLTGMRATDSVQWSINDFHMGPGSEYEDEEGFSHLNDGTYPNYRVYENKATGQ